MPFPLIIGAAVAVCGVAALGGHLSAKEKNEKAQNIVKQSQEKYEKAKKTLEKKQEEVNVSFIELMQNKKIILESVMQRFAESYNKIKNFNLKESSGIQEIDKMEFGVSELKQLTKLSQVYKEAENSIDDSNIAVALGAAAGPAIAGTFMGGGLLAATFTSPLAVVGAPLFLFSAFKADEKADENLEKAETYDKENKVVIQKMKMSTKLCKAIVNKVKLYDSLLGNLQTLFIEYEKKMTKVINKAEKKGGISQANFSDQDLSLFAATRNIAKAVKMVIDTPIIDKDWNLTPESELNYDTGTKFLEMYNSSSEQS